MSESHFAPIIPAMGKGFSSGSPARWLAGLAAHRRDVGPRVRTGRQVPGLTYVNLGLHELGHMLTYSTSDLTNSLAGPIAQVAIPAAARHLLLLAPRRLGRSPASCLVWAATSALEVSLYVADAPTQTLDLLGDDKHDWAFILGPDGYDVMEKAPSLADTIRDGATIAAVDRVRCSASPRRCAAGAVSRTSRRREPRDGRLEP